MFDVIVVSASSQELANAGADALRGANLLHGANLLAVSDPSKEHRVGSGGAVLNALLVVGEELSARAGLTTLSVRPFETARIIILQIGASARGGSPHPCLPQALTAVPSAAGGAIVNGVCLTLHVASMLLASMPPGLAIASTDSLLALPADAPPLTFVPGADDVGFVVTVPLPLEQANLHGVCFPIAPPRNHGRVVPQLGRVLYRATDEQLRSIVAPDGTVPAYTGLLCLRARAAARLLELHVRSPLDACTCLGIDSGTPPLRLDLHADVLAPLAATDEAAFLDEQSAALSAEPRLLAARRVLWSGLRGEHGDGELCASGLGVLRLAPAPSAAYFYLGDTSAHHQVCIQPPFGPNLIPTAAAPVAADVKPGWSSPERPPKPATAEAASSFLCSFLAPETETAWPAAGASGRSVALGCQLPSGVSVGARCALVHCSLLSGTVVGEGAYLYGVHSPPSGAVWPPGLVAHENALHGGAAVLLLRHTSDRLHAHADDTSATFLARAWPAVHLAGATPELLWPAQRAAAGSGRTLWSARLFPVLSAAARASEWGLASWWRATRWLFSGGREGSAEEWASWERISFEGSSAQVDVRATLGAQQSLARQIALSSLAHRLMQKEPHDVRDEIRQLACGARDALDSLLSALDGLASASRPQMAARAFAAVAEALAMRAGKAGGLRSGPACNAEWVGALRPLRDGHVAEATSALAVLRGAWLEEEEPRMLVRAARHYEGAVAECISLCVQTCEVDAAAADTAVPFGAWALCETPCRIDLAGGWSDTPPVCYEHASGGTVINAAITVGGRCPIGAKSRRIVRPVVRISIDEGATFLEYAELADLADYNSPLAPGALPKCVLLFCGLFSLKPPDGASLAAQLEVAGSGIEVVSWSRLPTGSGLGTSSILAGALVSCIGRTVGKAYSAASLTHAVLQVEQMLTTGGGWQDQAGGLLPAIKRCSSAATLPLSVHSHVLPISSEAIDTLSTHLALVYTGKTRLARTLLQARPSPAWRTRTHADCPADPRSRHNLASDVLRRWYSANPAILANVHALVSNAHAMERALLDGDAAAVGACLDAYWAQKKIMCDAEPEAVTRMLAKVRPLVFGATLAGAGGGGFMLLVTREPHAGAAVAAALADEQCVMHEVAIDTVGLRTQIVPAEPVELR